MERPKIGFENVSKLILSGTLIFSGGTIVDSQPQAETISSQPSYQLFLPQIASGEFVEKCDKSLILYADGLSGEGHKTRAFFHPIENVAIDHNVEYLTILPQNIVDPEKTEWTASFLKALEKANSEDKKVILMGYSMGSREILEVVDSLINPASSTYNPTLIDSISALVFIAGRDNQTTHASEHPELPNYKKHYENITEETIKTISEHFKGRMWVFAQHADQIVPESQSINLARQLNATFIPVDVLKADGNPDSHFTTEESGIPIAYVLENLVDKDC